MDYPSVSRGRRLRRRRRLAMQRPVIAAGPWVLKNDGVPVTFTTAVDIAYGGDLDTDQGDIQMAIIEGHLHYVNNWVGYVPFDNQFDFQHVMQVDDPNPNISKSFWVRSSASGPAIPGPWVKSNSLFHFSERHDIASGDFETASIHLAISQGPINYSYGVTGERFVRGWQRLSAVN